MNISLRSGGELVTEAGSIRVVENEDGTLTIVGSGDLVKHMGESVMRTGRFHYEIVGVEPASLAVAPGAGGNWVAVSTSPLQVHVIRESMSNAEGWSIQVQEILSGSVTEVSGGEESGRAEAGDARFFELLISVLAARGGSMACDPDFANCKASAERACEPDSAQVTYLCNPSTGEVQCSWTCYNPEAP